MHGSLVRSRAKWSKPIRTRSWASRSAPARSVSRSWMRSSRIELERSPTFREEFYDASRRRTTSRARQTLARLKGRKLPHGRSGRAVDHRREPAALAVVPKRAAGHRSTSRPSSSTWQRPTASWRRRWRSKVSSCNGCSTPDVVVTYFNMDDPMVGGYTPDKVALRRAISLGYNADEEIRMIRRGDDESGAVAGAAIDFRLRRRVHQRNGELRPGPGARTA